MSDAPGKSPKTRAIPQNANPKQIPAPSHVPVMAIDFVKDLLGSVNDGPSDLATNPRYMQGFGE